MDAGDILVICVNLNVFSGICIFSLRLDTLMTRCLLADGLALTLMLVRRYKILRPVGYYACRGTVRTCMPLEANAALLAERRSFME